LITVLQLLLQHWLPTVQIPFTATHDPPSVPGVPPSGGGGKPIEQTLLMHWANPLQQSAFTAHAPP
jgi:hypothetical protein